MLVHLNNQIVPRDQARVDPFDRGFLMGDGVYEGLRSFDGRIVAMDYHVERLRDGLKALSIDYDAAKMVPLTDRLLEANGLRDAFVYWQISRGAPGPGKQVRTRVPDGGMTPTVFGFASPACSLKEAKTLQGRAAVTVQDPRWKLGQIKSISLLGSVLCAMQADDADADDAIIVNNGLVAEGTASNVVIAIDGPHGARIVTPSLESTPILAGVTRRLLLEAMPEIENRPVRVEELMSAREVMVTGSLTMVTAITVLNGMPVGDGRPGPIAKKMLDTLLDVIQNEHPVQAGRDDRQAGHTAPHATRSGA
ncbi:MAG: aminotransferase class IV [Phycisphaerales bacterium]|nr:aminotransferase class IV [Phycisphaerales bacterium]